MNGMEAEMVQANIIHEFKTNIDQSIQRQDTMTLAQILHTAAK